jgi:hypothetical protein
MFRKLNGIVLAFFRFSNLSQEEFSLIQVLLCFVWFVMCTNNMFFHWPVCTVFNVHFRLILSDIGQVSGTSVLGLCVLVYVQRYGNFGFCYQRFIWKLLKRITEQASVLLCLLLKFV